MGSARGSERRSKDRPDRVSPPIGQPGDAAQFSNGDEVSEVLQFHDATDVQVGYGIYINSILGVNLQ